MAERLRSEGWTQGEAKEQVKRSRPHTAIELKPSSSTGETHRESLAGLTMAMVLEQYLEALLMEE